MSQVCMPFAIDLSIFGVCLLIFHFSNTSCTHLQSEALIIDALCVPIK